MPLRFCSLLRRWFLRVAVTLLGVCPGVASVHAAGQPVAPLGWEDSVVEAASRNAELRSARARAEAADSRVRAARSGYFPQVNAEASTVDSSGSATTPGTTNSASLSANQNLFAGFLDEAKVEQAQANARVAQADLIGARAALSQGLKSAYAGLLAAQDSVRVTEEIVRRLTDNLRLVTLRFEGGRENKGSFLLTKATLQQAQLDNLQARQAVFSAQAELARVLGRDEPSGLRVTGLVPVVTPGRDPDYAALVTHVPDYRRAQAQEELARADVRVARAGFYPTLDVSATVGREGGDFLPDDSRRTLGLTLNIPLFSGGRDYYGTQAAASNLDAVSSNRADVERQSLVRLKRAYAAWVEAVERLKVDEAFLEAAITRADIGRSKYAAGLMSFEDWDRIETDLTLRQRTVLLSRRDRVVAEADWELAQGIGVIP